MDNNNEKILKIALVCVALLLSSFCFAAQYSKQLVDQAQAGNAKAQYHVGQSVYFGQGVTKDKYIGFVWMLKSAQQGYAPAQLSVGESYYWGIGTDKNKYKAVEWYQKASEQKNTNAMYQLSMAYLLGEGVQQDIKKGNTLKIQAANMGNTKAQIDLAQSYRTGDENDEIPKNLEKAAYWYSKAAALGDKNALNNLAYMYAMGDGVTQNHSTALKYYLMAVQKGEDSSQVAICGYYLESQAPLPQDFMKTRSWCQAAADKNNNDAKLLLGRIYAQGLGVKQDKAKALYWYKQVDYEAEAQHYINVNDRK